MVSTWYRPPKSSPDSIGFFENLIGKIDAENVELYLLGDLNCNFPSTTLDEVSTDLLNILDVYGLTQLIKEPTRICPTTQTLLHLCITNSSEKIINFGVIHLGIRDHSLVYFIRKPNLLKTDVNKIIIKRKFNHFNETNFLNDLSQLRWHEVCLHDNPNKMWEVWKKKFLNVID